MKLFSLVIGAISAIAVIAAVLLIAGVHFERPVSLQGAALYNPANEVVLKGIVREVHEYTCPVSEGEMGEHVLLKTEDGIVQVHLAPGRILRSQTISFAAGDQISVVGSRLRLRGQNDVIAREISRGKENFIFRDREGKLMLIQ